MNILNELDSLPEFTSHLLAQLRKVYEIELANVFVDHRCIRVDSISLYETTKQNLLALQGKLLSEKMIGGRQVSVFDYPHLTCKLINYDTLIELAAPKAVHTYQNGLQHIEVVIPNIDELLQKYPHLAWDRSGYHKNINRDVSLHFPKYAFEIKFHEQSLREVLIAEEKVSH